MALKVIVKTLDGLDEATKKLYVQKDGEFHLDVEGLPEDPKLGEFRENNRKLNAKVTELTDTLKQFEGVDAAKYKEYELTQHKLRDKQLIDAGKIDELLNSKIDPIKKEFQTKLEAAQKENSALSGRLEILHIDNQLTELGTKKGLRPTAIEDMLARGRRVFRLKDGQVVALDQDGAQARTKSGDPLTMPAWLDTLATEAPHLFQPSNGGGANNNNGNGHHGAKTLSRGEFQKLAPESQMQFVTKDGGRVLD